MVYALKGFIFYENTCKNLDVFLLIYQITFPTYYNIWKHFQDATQVIAMKA